MASSRGGDGDFSSGSDSNSYRNNGGGSCLWNFLCCRSSTNYQNGYGCYFNCYIDEENRSRWLHLIAKLTKTIVWRTIHVIFSLFLLFGPAVQNLIIECGVTGDTIFSIIRICMLLFFIVDMTVRCITEERYFVYSLCKRGNGGGNNTSDGFDSTFAIGSFMFWCDLISTVSILYDLPSINKGRYAMIKSTWEVINGSLKPLLRSQSYNYTHRLAANGLECDVLFVIMRSARCARFVQNRDVVGASNKINVFGLYKVFQKLNPFRYFPMKREGSSFSVTEGNEESMIPTADGKLRSKDTTQIASMLSAVHAEAEKEARKMKQDGREQNTSYSQGAWEKVKTAVLRTDKNIVKHEAATKIQRAWRNYVRFEFDGEWGDIADLNQASVRSNQGSPPSKMKMSSFVSLTELNASGKFVPKSRFQLQSRPGNGLESQVGRDMRIATGQRVAIGILFVLVFTVLFTYTEGSLTRVRTMVALHTLTMNPLYRELSLEAAVQSSVKMLYEYKPANGTKIELANSLVNSSQLRSRDIMNITIKGDASEISFGLFDNSKSVKEEAIVEIVSTFFIIIFWFLGVLSFSGPISLLVITPIEQMVRLLGMLSSDPLGYENTPQFKRYLDDEDAIYQNTRWEKDILRGMETSFLKSTILRIGSLMKVGFGSAGVEIIQNNLEKGQNKNMLILNSQGSTVSCIFLFCDIRQFTDATEQLQEEVFVFVNRVASVVHSICNSYGGAANKNVGDAFLVSWPLDAKGSNEIDSNEPLKAKSNQADKALLSVIKICMSLTYDNFFLEPLSYAARGRLKTKLKDRTGPVVQIGFGLHAGKAVQGAIGSQRKIDATYVSESVERSEFLETSTKKYGLKLLMSGDFHKLLHFNTRRRCRKIDRILLLDNGDEYYEDNDELRGDLMELFTFDMDTDVIHRSYINNNNTNNVYIENVSDGPSRPAMRNKRQSTTLRNRRKFLQRGTRSSRSIIVGTEEVFDVTNSSNPIPDFNNGLNSNSPISSTDEYRTIQRPPLPSGPALYSHNVWQSPEMKKIRDKYVKGPFFQKYNAGLQAYYNKDWKLAKSCFQAILNSFDDGPSKYFMEQINGNNGVPPKDFRDYGIAD